MMQSLANNLVLLVIDVQKGFDSPYWGTRNNPQAEANISTLLQIWRDSHRPVIHVRHMSTEPDSPLRPGQPGNDFKLEAQPARGERVEEKNVNSAFIGTGLEEFLRQNGFDTIVICGLTTDHCISTTTRMAGNLGFKTYVVADATATFDRTGFDGK
ncbi:MAG: cysteine hydrolase, partial [Cyanobacteria bacterium]|nr:cysteine hydrolase [Cyanobacteriota bacterium]